MTIVFTTADGRRLTERVAKPVFVSRCMTLEASGCTILAIRGGAA